MKILVLSSRYPYPLEKGDKLRLYHQIKYLSTAHEVVLCSLTQHDVSAKDLAELEKYCERIYVFKLSWWRTIWRLFRAFLSGQAFSIGYFYSAAIQKKISKVVREELPDHIFCNLIRMSEYVRDVHVDKTLDYMDSFSNIMLKRAEASNFLMKILLRRESQLLRKYEEKIYYSFDNHCVISENDRANLGANKKQTIAVIPNGIDIAYFHPRAEVEKKYDLVFAGNLGYFPNICAVLYLVEEIYPKLLLWNPEIRILIAGARPDVQLQKLANRNIEVKGWMDDIREAYWQSKILVAPIFQGAGQQNKIMEAMACRVPCITTSQVQLAYEAFLGESLLVANHADEFCSQIQTILSDEKLYEKVANSGLSQVAHMSWEVYGAKLDRLLMNNNW